MSASTESARPGLVIGVGSPHGDDRAGWQVIDQLAEMWAAEHPLLDEEALPTAQAWQLHKAVVPHDILDWLTAAAQVHLIDASLDATPRVRRYAVIVGAGAGELDLKEIPLDDHEPKFASTMPSVYPLQLRSNSTHQFDLLSSLALASILGLLSPCVTLWTISVEHATPTTALSTSTQLLVNRCADQIARALK